MTISNNDDVIDSRDVIERIEELEDELEGIPPSDLQDERDELVILRTLAEQGEEYAPDWRYGETLIRDSYFTECCEDLCKEIGAIPENTPTFITNNIDWDGVAEDLKIDYTEIEYDDVTYLIR